MATEIKEKEIRKDWPVVEGTTFGTTKQVGKKFLHPTEKSLVKRNDKVGMN